MTKEAETDAAYWASMRNTNRDKVIVSSKNSWRDEVVDDSKPLNRSNTTTNNNVVVSGGSSDHMMISRSNGSGTGGSMKMSSQMKSSVVGSGDSSTSSSSSNNNNKNINIRATQSNPVNHRISAQVLSTTVKQITITANATRIAPTATISTAVINNNSKSIIDVGNDNNNKTIIQQDNQSSAQQSVVDGKTRHRPKIYKNHNQKDRSLRKTSHFAPET